MQIGFSTNLRSLMMYSGWFDFEYIFIFKNKIKSWAYFKWMKLNKGLIFRNLKVSQMRILNLGYCSLSKNVTFPSNFTRTFCESLKNTALEIFMNYLNVSKCKFLAARQSLKKSQLHCCVLRETTSATFLMNLIKIH